jgi:uncharacterized membrane protein YfcA
MDLNAIQWAVAIVSAIIIGMSKTGLPGVGILCVPLMATILPAKASTGIVLPMLIFADIFAVVYYHRHAVWPHLVRLMPWALAGIIIGYFIMHHITDFQLKPIIGAIVLAMLALNYLRNKFNSDGLYIPTQWYFAAAMGLAAGITTMLANAAGPIMIIYLLAMRLPKNEFIGTGAWYFLILNWVKVPFSMSLGLITAASLKFNLILFPFVGLGAVAGIFLLQWIPQKLFNIAVQVLAVLAALNMLLRF